MPLQLYVGTIDELLRLQRERPEPRPTAIVIRVGDLTVCSTPDPEPPPWFIYEDGSVWTPPPGMKPLWFVYDGPEPEQGMAVELLDQDGKMLAKAVFVSARSVSVDVVVWECAGLGLG